MAWGGHILEGIQAEADETRRGEGGRGQLRGGLRCGAVRCGAVLAALVQVLLALALALIRRVVWAGAGRAARLKLETQNQKANWPAALLSGLQGELRLGRRGTAAGQDRAVQCRGTRHLG